MNREIRICYCKIISADDSGAWEQLVFADTYRKFLLQVQHFDRRQKYSTYAEIVHQVPGSQRLDFLVSTAITGYRKQLSNLFPDVKNVLGKKFLPFHNYRFEMISSNIRAQSGAKDRCDFL
ncbi:hypothetical protein A8C56_11995 [Niabella ginsenosidivorans]|uniref:Uncharacterized protein n=1 Tax=Niabella ginsenosidivorans TaxID=1176587 RepID=A0A1A9I4J9_9BACT|nr:hypothetical protein [Niabella ginsenosidivorans]ANH81601.1 hypothetical protein A8C56_11995 [Niabella ginsenosidivorans]